MSREMRIIISSLLLILSLHFLLQGINFRKKINLCKNKREKFTNNAKKDSKNLPDGAKKLSKKVGKKIESFTSPEEILEKSSRSVSSQELLNSIQCKKPPVVSTNKFIDDKNDSNFQSNVLNVNRFYQKNTTDTPDLPDNKSSKESSKINPLSNENQFSNQPEQWNYKNEFVMNGGELLNGITGFDNLSDQYSSFNCESSDLSSVSSISGESCKPPTRGATVNDDLRMGMGVTGLERRMVA